MSSVLLPGTCRHVPERSLGCQGAFEPRLAGNSNMAVLLQSGDSRQRDYRMPRNTPPQPAASLPPQHLTEQKQSHESLGIQGRQGKESREIWVCWCIVSHPGAYAAVRLLIRAHLGSPFVPPPRRGSWQPPGCNSLLTSASPPVGARHTSLRSE